MINAFWQPVLFRVQEGDAGDWKRLIDTSRPSPDDIRRAGNERFSTRSITNSHRAASPCWCANRNAT
jgi:glycogen operon protein